VGGGSIQKSPEQDYSNSKAAKKAKQTKKPGKHCVHYSKGNWHKNPLIGLMIFKTIQINICILQK
jgi:hypothetical protein